MHSAAHTYNKNAAISLTPRDLEAHLLLKAAAKLQAIKDGWPAEVATLEEQLSDNRKLWENHGTLEESLAHALLYNRRLWTIFVGSVTGEDSALPINIRENIANLGLFVFKRTIDMEAGPLPEKLSALIEINRNVAAGLRGQD